jgi:molybdopterin synthase sulfur carrier subunit
MPVSVRIPTPLRSFTAGKEVVLASGTTVGEVLENLDSAHPGLKDKLCDERGRVRRFVNIYANDEDIRFLEELDTPLDEGDEVSIVPAIAGG